MPMDLDSDQQQDRSRTEKSDFKYKSYEEEKTGNANMTYLERCKIVGRVGPKEAMMDKKTMHGQFHFKTKENLDLECLSQFGSIRGNVGVFNGRYYYEVLLKTNGLFQIGWCTLQTTFNTQNGVGDDSTSYAYDGYRVKKWNKEPLDFGEAWSVGDIIGTLIDFDRREIKFWRNCKCLGRAFVNIKKGPNVVYFPAISMQRGQRCVFNFGRQQLCQTSNNLYALLEEPQSLINHYNKVTISIIDCLKSFLITFWEFQQVPVDQRLAVGCLLVEYLYPLVLDDYMMEEQLLQFFYEVTMIKKDELKDLIFDLLEMSLNPDQLKTFISKLMNCLVKKIINVEIVIVAQNKPTKKEFEMTYF